MKLRDMIRRFLFRAAPGYTLRMLGFPSYEDLEKVGLTRQEFHARYVASVKPGYWESVDSLSQRILARFWADYPDARKKERDGKP